MKSLKIRVTGISMLVAIFLSVALQSNGQVASCGNEGFRDFFEDCSVSLRANILNVNVLIEASGSKNNCLKSEQNVCDSYGCVSSAVTYVIENINKPG